MATPSTERTREATAKAPANSILAGKDPKELQRALDRLEKLEEKERKAQERTRKYGERSRAYTHLMVEKAKKQGIKVSEAEVQAYIKANKSE